MLLTAKMRCFRRLEITRRNNCSSSIKWSLAQRLVLNERACSMCLGCDCSGANGYHFRTGVRSPARRAKILPTRRIISGETACSAGPSRSRLILAKCLALPREGRARTRRGSINSLRWSARLYRYYINSKLHLRHHSVFRLRVETVSECP